MFKRILKNKKYKKKLQTKRHKSMPKSKRKSLSNTLMPTSKLIKTCKKQKIIKKNMKQVR